MTVMPYLFMTANRVNDWIAKSSGFAVTVITKNNFDDRFQQQI